MFRDLLSSRLIQAGLAFFVLVVGGSLLYSWHVQSTTESDMERHDRFLEGKPEKQNGGSLVESVGVGNTNETAAVVNTPTEQDTNIVRDTEATTDSPSDSEILNAMDAFLADDVATEETPAEEVSISPFGFGPYPEVPADFPEQDIWDDISTSSMSPDHELIARVQIKLWNQGIHTLGATYDGTYRLIYPILDDVVYYEEKFGANGSGTRRALTSPATDDKYGSDLLKGIFAPHLTVYIFPDGGIDPYEFLDLPR